MNPLVEKLRFQTSVLVGDLDSKDPNALSRVRFVADAMLAECSSHAVLAQLEADAVVAGVKETIPNLGHLALKLAKSRAAILEMPPTHVSVVIPMYGENTRIKVRGTAAGQDPNGEDAIWQKALQLEWLFEGTHSTYEVLYVDDMSKEDPIQSGVAAQDVIEWHKLQQTARVLFLEDGVKNEKSGTGLVVAALRGVEIPKNTKKAAAVYYGCAKAITEYTGGLPHVVFTTDLDLTIDLGQMGNLVKPVVDGTCVAAAASRRLPTSILELGSGRNLRANAARYFRLLLLPNLLPKDTQCGAKAFNAQALSEVLAEGMQVLSFSFDIELLAKLAMRFGADKVLPVAVAAFDSAAMTTTDSSVHHEIMRTQEHLAKQLKLGSGAEYEAVLALSEKLSASEDVWMRFLAGLEQHPELVERVQALDAGAASELEALIS